VVSDGGIASPPHTRKRLSRTAGKETTPKAPGSRKKPASPTPPEPTKKEPAHTPKGEEPEGKEAPKKPAPKPGPEQPASKKPAPKPGPKQPTEPPPAKGDKRKEAADAIDRFRAGLNADSVRMVVRHHLPQVRVCYDRALKQKPDLAGIVEIRFTISDKGRVGASSVYRNTSGHDGLGKCLAITIKRWRFPRPVGGAMDFVYPFVFSSSN
jgi:TonB family protein